MKQRHFFIKDFFYQFQQKLKNKKRKFKNGFIHLYTIIKCIDELNLGFEQWWVTFYDLDVLGM